MALATDDILAIQKLIADYNYAVDAGFYYVRTDRLVRPPGLATRAEIERLLGDPA